MRWLLYLLLIGVFGTLGFMLTPAVGLAGLFGGWLCATGILWSYDSATSTDHWNGNGWFDGPDIGAPGTIFDFKGFDGTSGDAGSSD